MLNEVDALKFTLVPLERNRLQNSLFLIELKGSACLESNVSKR